MSSGTNNSLTETIVHLGNTTSTETEPTSNTRISKKLTKSLISSPQSKYRRKKRSLELDIYQMRLKAKQLQKELKNIKSNQITNQELILIKEQIKNSISQTAHISIQYLMNDITEIYHSNARLKSEIDTISFQIENERLKRDSLHEISNISDIDFYQDVDFKTDYFEHEVSNVEYQKLIYESQDLQNSLANINTNILSALKPKIGESTISAAHAINKNFMAMLNHGKVIGSFPENDLAKLNEKIKSSNKMIINIENEIQHCKDQIAKIEIENASKSSELESRNQKFEQNSKKELSILDKKIQTLMIRLDESGNLFDQIVEEIRTIENHSFSYEISEIPSDLSIECDYDLYEDTYDETIQNLTKQKYTLLDELNAMQKQYFELRDSAHNREDALRQQITKMIQQFKINKQILHGGLPFPSYDSDSSGLMSLDLMSFTK